MSPVPATTNRELRGSDVAAVREQLGREPTTPFTVVVRCTGGHPLVIPMRLVTCRERPLRPRTG